MSKQHWPKYQKLTYGHALMPIAGLNDYFDKLVLYPVTLIAGEDQLDGGPLIELHLLFIVNLYHLIILKVLCGKRLSQAL